MVPGVSLFPHPAWHPDQQQQLGTFPPRSCWALLRPNSEPLIPRCELCVADSAWSGDRKSSSPGKLGGAFPPQPPLHWKGVRGARMPASGESSARESQMRLGVSGHCRDPRGQGSRMQGWGEAGPLTPAKPLWMSDRDLSGSDDGAEPSPWGCEERKCLLGSRGPEHVYFPVMLVLATFRRVAQVLWELTGGSAMSACMDIFLSFI